MGCFDEVDEETAGHSPVEVDGFGNVDVDIGVRLMTFNAFPFADGFGLRSDFLTVGGGCNGVAGFGVVGIELIGIIIVELEVDGCSSRIGMKNSE